MLKKVIKLAKFLIVGLLLLLLVLPAGTGNAKSHKSRGRSVGAAHSYVYKSKKASKSYRASNSGSRSGRKTRVSYRPKARVTRHKSAPKRKSYPRKSIPKRMHAASPRKAKPRVSKAKRTIRHASHKAAPKHKATPKRKVSPKHKNKKASKSKTKAGKKHSTSKKRTKSKAHSKKKQGFIGKLWTSAKKKAKAAVHKAAKKVKKAVHHAVKAVRKVAKSVQKFVKKHANAITTTLAVLSVAATVVAFATGVGEVASIAAGVALVIDAGFTAMNASNAITGHDLLTGVKLGTGSRVLNGGLAILGIAAPFAGRMISKAPETRLGSMIGEITSKARVTSHISKLRSVDNPLESISFTDKVIEQMGQKDFHAFPEQVEAFGKNGKIERIVGGDGISRIRISIKGMYKNKDGEFEYILEPNGKTCNHRFFRSTIKK